MKRKTKGSATASIILFVTSGLMASVLGLRQYDRATSTQAWVTSLALPAGAVISADTLTRERVPKSTAGIENPRQLIGQQLKVSKAAGETIQAGDIAPRVKASSRTLAQHVPEGRVLYSLPLGADTTTPLTQLHAGDRLDVLVRNRQGVRTAATDVRLIGVMRPRRSGSPTVDDGKITSLLPQRSARDTALNGVTTLVLAVHPEHVYPLAHIATSDAVSLVIHSAVDVASGRQVSVTPARAERPIEVVEGLQRSTVYVKQ